MLDQWKIAARSLLPGKIMVRQTVLELLQWFAITLTALTTFITIILVVQKAVLMGLGLTQILVLLPFGALASLQFSVPGTVLFATCVVFGRLASGNELTALKSLGISPLRVLLPVYILAFLLSLCSVWLNDLAVSWGDLQMRRIMIASLEDVVYGVLKSGGAYRAPRFSVVVRGVRGRTLINPTIKYVSENGADISFSSESAELRGDPEANTMNVFVANTRMETEGMDFNSPRESVIAIPLNDLSRKDQPDVRIANLAMWEIPNRVATTLRDIAKVRQTMAASAALDMVTGDLDRLVGKSWRANEGYLRELHARLAKLRAEPQRRWANGFSCLAFVFVGAPVAIRLRNADVMTSFFSCFLPILLVYYPLLLYGGDLAKNGTMPPAIVWMGNLVLLASGGYFLRWVMRY